MKLFPSPRIDLTKVLKSYIIKYKEKWLVTAIKTKIHLKSSQNPASYCKDKITRRK